MPERSNPHDLPPNPNILKTISPFLLILVISCPTAACGIINFVNGLVNNYQTTNLGNYANEYGIYLPDPKPYGERDAVFELTSANQTTGNFTRISIGLHYWPQINRLGQLIDFGGSYANYDQAGNLISSGRIGTNDQGQLAIETETQDNHIKKK